MARAQTQLLDEVEQTEEPVIYEPPADLLRLAQEAAADPEPDQRAQRTEEAMKKLHRIALDYQRSTPSEVVVFGRGQLKFTLGDLRDLFGLGE